MKVIKKVQVKNKLGLHTRPATTIVKLLQNSKSSVEFTSQKSTINAKSLLSILMLSATKNSNITITVEGEDAETTMDLLVTAFNGAFGENQI